MLTWTGNQWEPRTPVIVTPPGVDPVQSPGGSNEYRIVAAGTLALFRPEIPAVGTPGLRVTPEGRIASANHQLIEFTYTHHFELFQRSFHRNHAPMHGFVVKAMLVPMMSEWPDVVGDPNLRERGLAWLREQSAAALERSAAAWVVLGPVTISCELVSEAGIVLRVTTGRVISQVRQLFDNALLNVEVSWCPRWRPEANP